MKIELSIHTDLFEIVLNIPKYAQYSMMHEYFQYATLEYISSAIEYDKPLYTDTEVFRFKDYTYTTMRNNFDSDLLEEDIRVEEREKLCAGYSLTIGALHSISGPLDEFIRSPYFDDIKREVLSSEGFVSYITPLKGDTVTLQFSLALPHHFI